MTDAQVRVLDGFDDARLDRDAWQEMLRSSSTDVVFLTKEWQRAWWDTFEPGRLLLILAERGGRPIALAPLFALSGMAFFVGSGGSDYLDFVGDVSDPSVLEAILRAARDEIPDFVGLRFHHVPGSSPTAGLLERAAGRLGLGFFEEGSLPAPALRAGPDGDLLRLAAKKKSLVRHERGLARDGDLEIVHMTEKDEVLPHLDEFFDQHVGRWTQTPYPSLFLDDRQRCFYRRMVEAGGSAGWLRFTRVEWNGDAVAFHLGSQYNGRFLWYKPSFATALAKRSPGEVLLRSLLLAAAEEGALLFDFGLGDEAFKARFATHTDEVHTYGLYPLDLVGPLR